MRDEQLELALALSQSAAGNAEATRRATHAVHRELQWLTSQVLGRPRSDHLLRTAVLVNEAFVRLFGIHPLEPTDEEHYLRLAAREMRAVVIAWVREHPAADRPCQRCRPLRDAGLIQTDCRAQLMALDDSLLVLRDLEPDVESVVELIYFGGYTLFDTARILSMDEARVKDHWTFGLSWLRQRMAGI